MCVKDRNRGRTKAVKAPYVPSRVVRDGALMSGLLPSVRERNQCTAKPLRRAARNWGKI